ncbi:hypothetical protein CNMCM7691_003765 [Aspergillus felis]|uniref:Uncharacterized protein n=1 Tax=Aspergillus felis TaxID=1287682 RepID=A0A8H6QRW4_9EURO|nr:hypothetical protein CNMCM7691_003765 [Aspergillus felis]
MSSQSDTSRPGEDRQEGFTKYLKRMKTILKRSPTARSSISSMQEITERAEPSQVASPSPTPGPAQKPAAKPATQPTVVTHWSAIQEEKARALFAKYGLTFEPGEWKTPSDMTVQRVAKPIRMRVRRTCHRCETTFGPDKVCVNCQHIRCTKCPRHASTEPNDQAQNALETIRAAQGHGPPRRLSKESQLTIPSRTGGQDLIRKPHRQRVRRTYTYDARNVLENRPNRINIRMAILETQNLRQNRQHEPGRNHDRGCATLVTNALRSMDLGRRPARIAVRRRDRRLYEIRRKSINRIQIQRS